MRKDILKQSLSAVRRRGGGGLLLLCLCLPLLGLSACSPDETPGPYLSLMRGEETLQLGMTRAEADAVLGESDDDSYGKTHHEFYVVTDWYAGKAVRISLINDASDWRSGFGVSLGSTLDEVESALGHLPSKLDNDGHYRTYYFTLEKGEPVPPADLDASDVYQIGVNIGYDTPVVDNLWLGYNRADEWMSEVYYEEKRKQAEMAAPPQMGPWEPPSYDSREAFYRALEDWVDAYRAGEYAQLYIDGPGDGAFVTRRLTCSGSQEYVIESRYWGSDMPVTGCYSQQVTEGLLHYSFGGDVHDSEHPSITLFRGDYEMELLGADTAEWERQSILSAAQAEYLARLQLRPYYFPVSCGSSVHRRFTFAGVCFYGVRLSGGGYSEHVAVSADGATFMSQSIVDGTWWLSLDLGERQVLPGDSKPTTGELWGYRQFAQEAPSPLAEQLVGAWNGADSADVSADRYLFQSDGTYIFSENREDPLAERRYTAGAWWVDGNTLHLSAVNILNYTGSRLEGSLFLHSFELEQLIGDGEYAYITRGEAERQVSSFPIEVMSGDSTAPRSMRMGEYRLWQVDVALDDMLVFRDYGA